MATRGGHLGWKRSGSKNGNANTGSHEVDDDITTHIDQTCPAQSFPQAYVPSTLLYLRHGRVICVNVEDTKIWLSMATLRPASATPIERSHVPVSLPACTTEQTGDLRVAIANKAV